MRYSPILTRAFFTTITVFLTVTVTSGVDCTPTGTWLSDTFSGACPSLESNNITNIGKSGHWNISWPDGHLDGLTAKGSGQCARNYPCGVTRQPGHTICWPLFHQPQRTAAGRFSIVVKTRLLK
jgi:hypothetical protein